LIANERLVLVARDGRLGSISVVRGNISTDEDVDDAPRISFEGPSATDGGASNQAEYGHYGKMLFMESFVM